MINTIWILRKALENQIGDQQNKSKERNGGSRWEPEEEGDTDQRMK
jgi:hypothetical protein